MAASMGLLAFVPALMIIVLLVRVFWLSFETSILDSQLTLANYLALYSDRFAYGALINTLGFSVVTLIISFLFGVPIAWLTERTDINGRSIIYVMMTIGVFIPSFFTAMGWIFLFHPRIGALNNWIKTLFGLSEAPFSIINIPGMGLVQGMGLASVVFLLTSGSLRAMDSRLEETAQMSGAGFWAVMRRITLPLAWPGLLAAGLYVFTIAIGAFDVPLVIGLSNRLYTFSTYLYVMSNPLNGVPKHGLVAAFACFMIILALLLSWWYSSVLNQSRKYQVVSGKAYQPRLVKLGKWRWLGWAFIAFYILSSKIMPLLMMIWASLLPYFQAPSLASLANVSLRNFMRLDWSLVLIGLKNTLILMIVSPAMALAMSLVFSWIVLRSRNRFKLVFDFVAFLPHAVPSAIFAFAMLVVSLSSVLEFIDVSSSIILIVIVLSLTMLSFGTRITNGALIQLHPELEEAAHMSGASGWTVAWRILIPLLKPSLLFGWLWMALLTFRELTIPTVLFSADNITFSVVAWSLWNGGSLPAAAAVNLIMITLISPLIIIYLYYAARSRMIT
jgi:iron(III) transport system permease protein